MVDHDLVMAKAGSIRRHLRRISEKGRADVETFLSDIDRQEVISFNLHLAIENCTDLAAHIISEEGLGVPGSASEMFYLLELIATDPHGHTQTINFCGRLNRKKILLSLSRQLTII